MHSQKTRIKFNRPVYVGNRSKVHMYDFWYNHIKKKYGDKAQLCYTDTDSFLYLVETEDVYADMKADSHLYGFSDYTKDRPCYDQTNNKAPGKFKDECKGMPIAEVVAVLSKMYSV